MCPFFTIFLTKFAIHGCPLWPFTCHIYVEIHRTLLVIQISAQPDHNGETPDDYFPSASRKKKRLFSICEMCVQNQ
jgi:hypothetical protein